MVSITLLFIKQKLLLLPFVLTIFIAQVIIQVLEINNRYSNIIFYLLTSIIYIERVDYDEFKRYIFNQSYLYLY